MCSACSQNRLELRQRVHVTDPSNKPERVCDGCYVSLTQHSNDRPPPPSGSGYNCLFMFVTMATVAATVVSKALLKQAGPHPSNHHDNNSDESEDSDDSDTEVKNDSSVVTQEVAKVTVAMDNSVIEDPTPPPRRKKEQKSVKKPPVIARTKKDFTQLHQDFAPSEVITIYGL